MKVRFRPTGGPWGILAVPGILKANDLVNLVGTLGLFRGTHGNPGQSGRRRRGREPGHGDPYLGGGRLYVADCVWHAAVSRLSGVFRQDMALFGPFGSGDRPLMAVLFPCL